MSQTAVSNHLRGLEERFGVVLLARGRRLEATLVGVTIIVVLLVDRFSTAVRGRLVY